MSVQESNKAVENFIAQYGLTYPFLLDTNGDASLSYNVYTTPTTYFVNPDGVIHEPPYQHPPSRQELDVRIPFCRVHVYNRLPKPGRSNPH